MEDYKKIPEDFDPKGESETLKLSQLNYGGVKEKNGEIKRTDKKPPLVPKNQVDGEQQKKDDEGDS